LCMICGWAFGLALSPGGGLAFCIEKFLLSW
jgi:hypothetical protein